MMMVRIKATSKAEKSKSGVKAGHTAPKNVGGIINRKAIKISAKRKNG